MELPTEIVITTEEGAAAIRHVEMVIRSLKADMEETWRASPTDHPAVPILAEWMTAVHTSTLEAMAKLEALPKSATLGETPTPTDK